MPLNTTLSLLHQWPIFLLLFILLRIHTCHGDVGIAAQYSAPYLPTECYGGDQSQLPTSNMFAAAGEGIWDNGAACGRQYLVRCISASQSGTCIPNITIQVKVLDYALKSVSKPSADGATIVLSSAAFSALANASAATINVEFQQNDDSLGKKQNVGLRLQLKFLAPLIYVPVLPLIRILLRHNPVVRDRWFTVVVAGAFAHGFYLIMDLYYAKSK